jgi:SH3-like domain-containing protein
VPGRTVIVVAAAPIRQQAQDAAAIVFQAERGVVLDLLEGSVPGWARVRHRDGGIGFVRVSDVWGL